MRFFNTIIKFVLIWSLIGFNNFAISENLVEKAANRANFEPGGEFHLFGARGGVTDQTGEIKLGLPVSENLGSIRIERQFAAGEIEYKTKFSGHGWEEHSPFANASSKHKETKKPQSDDLESIAFLDWTGVEIHPDDGYDGPQGGGYPKPTGARDEYSYDVYAVRQKVSVITPDYRDHFNKFIDKKDRINQAYSDAVNNNFEDAYHRGIHGKEGNLNALGDTAQRLKGLGKDVEAGLDYAWDTSGALLSSTAGLTSETLEASAASLAQPVFDRLSVEKQFSTIDSLLEKQQQIKDFSDTSYDYYQQNVVPVIDKTLEPVRENVVKPVIQKYDELQTNYGEFATDHPNIAEAIAAGGAILDSTPAGQGKKQALKQAKNLTEEIGKNSARGTEKVADKVNTAAVTATNTAKTPDNFFPDTSIPLLKKPKYEGTNPWAEGVPIVSMDAPENFYINMAQSPGQKGPGGWGTQDYIPNVNYVRNQLAVTPGFKPKITEVQTYLIPEGIHIQTGTVGPQTHNGVTYPGGGTQVEIYNYEDRHKLIPIGKPRPIK